MLKLKHVNIFNYIYTNYNIIYHTYFNKLKFNFKYIYIYLNYF